MISLVTNAFVDLPPNPSGDGVLADIEFTALASGVSPLSFSNVFLNFSDQGFDISNGQITVTGTTGDGGGGGGGGDGGATVPEPTTLVLFTGGLVLLGVRHLIGGVRRRDEF